MKAFAATRRGRPKRVVANDNGPDARGRDLGTPEAQLKRAFLAQGADPVASAHPLDLLLARGFIDAAMHRAGFRYAGLYRQIIGRTEVSYGRLYDGLSGDGRSSGDAGEVADLADRQRSFRQAQMRLRAEGPVVAGLTERLSVFGVWPDRLRQKVTLSHRELDLLRRGLARLAQAQVRGNAHAVNDNGPDDDRLRGAR
ncbi:MAG: hypothetical protein IPK59_12020 [Rhodospirillaceae bacterium]|nr:hypothetical protein [Rhodospirillaceae bacterium]